MGPRSSSGLPAKSPHSLAVPVDRRPRMGSRIKAWGAVRGSPGAEVLHLRALHQILPAEFGRSRIAQMYPSGCCLGKNCLIILLR